jgi:hypothetical protein
VFAIAWKSREILDIKRGVGYKVRDIFDEDNELFIYDKSSSETAPTIRLEIGS